MRKWLLEKKKRKYRIAIRDRIWDQVHLPYVIRRSGCWFMHHTKGKVIIPLHRWIMTNSIDRVSAVVVKDRLKIICDL